MGAAVFTFSFFVANLDAVKKPKEAPEPPAPAVARPGIPDLEFSTRLREEEFGHGRVMPRKPIRSEEPKAESESGTEKKGEPGPAAAG